MTRVTCLWCSQPLEERHGVWLHRDGSRECVMEAVHLAGPGDPCPVVYQERRVARPVFSGGFRS